MPNTYNSTSSYVDAAGVLLSTSTTVVAVSLTATAANAQLVLGDRNGTIIKADLRVAAAGTTQLFDFSRTPLVFPNGVKAVTVANAIATLIYN